MIRETCIECCIKHVAQAVVLLCEVPKGYPLHKWLAVGHLAEAEDECDINSIKMIIKDFRHQVMVADMSASISASSSITIKAMDIIDLLNQEVTK